MVFEGIAKTKLSVPLYIEKRRTKRGTISPNPGDLVGALLPFRPGYECDTRHFSQDMVKMLLTGYRLHAIVFSGRPVGKSNCMMCGAGSMRGNLSRAYAGNDVKTLEFGIRPSSLDM